MAEPPPKKDFPPGWNDPPMLSYGLNNPPPKSRITNKRIAFPLTSSSHNQSNEATLEPRKLPPLPLETEDECIESLYTKASENFNNLLEKIQDESIKEQIWQMLSNWQAHKFSKSQQNKLADLSINIVEGNTAKVNEIHLQLTMDNSNLLKVYLPALKHLINSYK